jgi:hypothetical protein
LAVEQNTREPGALFARVSEILQAVDCLAASHDAEAYHRAADAAEIERRALDHLAAPERRIAYPYFFCLPETLISQPELIFYYRNVAMLSADAMREIG